LPNTLNSSSTSKTIAAIIQPRLLRGRGADGAMTGGGGSGGGGEPTSGGVFISIVRASYPKAGRAANANGAALRRWQRWHAADPEAEKVFQIARAGDLALGAVGVAGIVRQQRQVLIQTAVAAGPIHFGSKFREPVGLMKDVTVKTPLYGKNSKSNRPYLPSGKSK
jgi:hypothetical protein